MQKRWAAFFMILNDNIILKMLKQCSDLETIILLNWGLWSCVDFSHNTSHHIILSFTVGPGWFSDEHFYTQVPNTWGRGPHLSDIITGRRGDSNSQGAASPGQTRARTDLPLRDQDLERDPLSHHKPLTLLCFYATSCISCLHSNHSTPNTQSVGTMCSINHATLSLSDCNNACCCSCIFWVSSPYTAAIGRTCA